MSHAIRLVVVDVVLVCGLIGAAGIAVLWGFHFQRARRTGYGLRPAGWLFGCALCLAVLVSIAGSALELDRVDLSRTGRIVHIVAYLIVGSSLVLSLRPGWLYARDPEMSDRMRHAASLIELAREGGPDAEDRCKEAIAEYAAASGIAPGSSVALYGWALAMVDLARIKGDGREADELVDQAQEKLRRASQLGSRDAADLLLETQSWHREDA